MQPVLSKIDRLSNLVAGMRIQALEHPPLKNAGLFVVRTGASFLISCDQRHADSSLAIAIRINWGMRGDPLLEVADKIDQTVTSSHPLFSILNLAFSELAEPRCGCSALLAGYGEVIVIHLLRDAVSSKTSEIGILGGLADHRLVQALVALHKNPGRDWRVDELAELAGMSRSAFMDRFARFMNEGPMSYLRRYRLAESREALATGERVSDVARRYGYGSPDAFSRAFRREQGVSPSKV